MNFLAHIYLSGDDEELMVGNFIADHVKGKQVLEFSKRIQEGIKLHRAIDTYTDQHEVVHQSKVRLRHQFRKYAPVIADIYYDHFLAVHWPTYHHQTLEEYVARQYHILRKYEEVLPARTLRMLGYMEQENWLLGYRHFEGMQRVLTGMSRRASFESNMEFATEELQNNYIHYEAEFLQFFPELKKFVENTGI
jgi:acyl carrier protein phosphodiesterase